MSVTSMIFDEVARERRIKSIKLGLWIGGFAKELKTSGGFDLEEQEELNRLLATPPGKNREGVNIMISTFKILGLNSALEADGLVGDELRKAVENFRRFLKQEKEK